MSEPPSRPPLGPTLSHPTTGLAPPQVVVLQHSDNQADQKQTKTKTKKHTDKQTQRQNIIIAHILWHCLLWLQENQGKRQNINESLTRKQRNTKTKHDYSSHTVTLSFMASRKRGMTHYQKVCIDQISGWGLTHLHISWPSCTSSQVYTGLLEKRWLGTPSICL